MHCRRSTSDLPPLNLTHTSRTMDISSDPLGSPSPSHNFRPDHNIDHEDDRSNLDIGSKSHIEAASHRSGLHHRQDEPREMDQSTRERSSRSFDPSGSEDSTFTDDNLAEVGGREVLVTSSPSGFESGSSVFVPERKQLPIVLASVFCFSVCSVFGHFLHSKAPATDCDPAIPWFWNAKCVLSLGVYRSLTASVDFR